jgi:hypothetical protein
VVPVTAVALTALAAVLLAAGFSVAMTWWTRKHTHPHVVEIRRRTDKTGVPQILTFRSREAALAKRFELETQPGAHEYDIRIEPAGGAR